MVTIRFSPVAILLAMLFLLQLYYFGYIDVFRRKIEIARDFHLVWTERQAAYRGNHRWLDDSTEEDYAEHGRENRQLSMFKEVEQWCAIANYSDNSLLPLASDLSLLHKREDVWDELKNRYRGRVVYITAPALLWTITFLSAITWDNFICPNIRNSRSPQCNWSAEQRILKQPEFSNDINLEFALALIITSNFPWRSTIGLLQRLYQPFFKVTIFCGTFYPDLFLKKEGFPDITIPFVHINLTEKDIYQGYFVYICLVRARELLLSEVEGFFVMSDDATFNFWHTLKLRKVLHPTGITWQGYTGMWWPSPYGSQAVQHALFLITDKYRNDWSTQNMWKKYQYGLIANGFTGTAHRQLTQVDGWCLSDFFYIPTAGVKYYSDLMIILHEAKVFHEIAISKYLYTVPHNRLDSAQYTYLWEDRDKWAELYNENLVLLHPIKFSQFTNLEARARFCDTVVRTFKRAVYSVPFAFKSANRT